MSTGCNPNDRVLKTEVSVSDVLLQPEITMTEVGEEVTDEKNGGNNLKRVNSVNNLAIPGIKVKKLQDFYLIEFGAIFFNPYTYINL